MNVVYIGGWMRSGTTLLAEMLGAQPGVLNVGELSGFWAGVQRDDRCSCGHALSRCPLWAEVLGDLDDAGVTSREREHLARLSGDLFRMRRWPQLRSAVRHGAWPAGSPWEMFADRTRLVLLRALARSQATTLVDSSKVPSWLSLHAVSADTDQLNLVHLVRDPRAVGVSARRAQALQSEGLGAPPPAPLARTTLDWSWSNLATLAARTWCTRYVALGYEDLLNAPQREMARVCQRVDVPFDRETVSQSTFRRHRPAHVVIGNPRRMDGDVRRLAPDDTWRTELTSLQARMIQLSTWPTRSALRRAASPTTAPSPTGRSISSHTPVDDEGK